MTRKSEMAFWAPIGFGRLSVAIAFLAVSISMAPEKVAGQTRTCSELIVDMAAQQKMISTFRTLDYQVREHFLIVANAIFSTYGGWSTKPGWATNAGQLMGSTGDFEEQAIDMRREIGRDKAMTAEEAERMNGAVDDFLVLIETGAKISEQIAAGGVDDANLTYFDTARTKYLDVHRELYTLIKAAEKRVASISRQPCS